MRPKVRSTLMYYIFFIVVVCYVGNKLLQGMPVQLHVVRIRYTPYNVGVNRMIHK